MYKTLCRARTIMEWYRFYLRFGNRAPIQVRIKVCVRDRNAHMCVRASSVCERERVSVREQCAFVCFVCICLCVFVWGYRVESQRLAWGWKARQSTNTAFDVCRSERVSESVRFSVFVSVFFFLHFFSVSWLPFGTFSVSASLESLLIRIFFSAVRCHWMHIRRLAQHCEWIECVCVWFSFHSLRFFGPFLFNVSDELLEWIAIWGENTSLSMAPKKNVEFVRRWTKEVYEENEKRLQWERRWMNETESTQ